jgi:hypothetical protein
MKQFLLVVLHNLSQKHSKLLRLARSRTKPSTLNCLYPDAFKIRPLVVPTMRLIVASFNVERNVYYNLPAEAQSPKATSSAKAGADFDRILIKSYNADGRCPPVVRPACILPYGKGRDLGGRVTASRSSRLSS